MGSQLYHCTIFFAEILSDDNLRNFDVLEDKYVNEHIYTNLMSSIWR